MNPQMIKMAVAAGLVFAGWKGYGKVGAVNTALIAVGAVTLARSAPVVNQYVG